MWEALPQMPHYAQVWGGSTCLACGSSSVKLGRSSVPFSVGRRRARQRLRNVPRPGKIAAPSPVSLVGGQSLGVRSVQLLDGASLQRRGAVLHDVVYSLTHFGGILPAHAEEETSDLAAESSTTEQDSVISDEAVNSPPAAESVDSTVVTTGVDSPSASGGEEVVSGSTAYKAGDNLDVQQTLPITSDEEVLSGSTAADAVDAQQSLPSTSGEEVVSGSTGNEAGDNVEVQQALPITSDEDVVSGSTAADAVDAQQSLPSTSSEEVVSASSGTEAGDNVDVQQTLPSTSGEEVDSGSTVYEAGENVPVDGQQTLPSTSGEDVVTAGTGLEASGVEQAAPGTVDVDSAGDTLADTPRVLKLKYEDLIGGSRSGSDGSSSGDIPFDPLGAINDALAAAQDAASKAISDVQTFLAKTISGIRNPSNEGGDTVALQTDTSSSSQSDFDGFVANPFEKVVDGAQKLYEDTFQKAFDGAQNLYEDTVSAVEQAAQNFADGITSSIDSTTNSVTGTVDSVRLNIQTSIDSSRSAVQEKALDNFGLFYPGTAANDALKGVVAGVKTNAGAAVVTAEEYAAALYMSIKDSFPQETQDALSNAESTLTEYSKPALSALERVLQFFLQLLKALGLDLDNPIFLTIALGLAVTYAGVLSWKDRYGGYTGDLDPKTALNILQKENNVALVDVRPQEERDTAGILDLRRGARFKNGSVEVVKVSPAVKKLVRNSRDIDNLVTGAIIRNLKIVNSKSKVILLDVDGRASKDVARALRKLGVQKQYRIDGGFSAWATAGLPIRSEGALTPITILREETQAIVEEVQPTADGVILVAIGIVAGGYAVYEWERALQLIGTLATFQFIYSKFQSYKSVDDLKRDFRNIRKPFQAVGGGIAWVLSQAQPKKLKLATTPSTSAVQDKVLQAAAKHGPHVPEVEVEVETEAEEEAIQALQTSEPADVLEPAIQASQTSEPADVFEPAKGAEATEIDGSEITAAN